MSNLKALLDSLQELEQNSHKEFEKLQSLEDLENFRVQWLGKKGQLTNTLKMMGKLDPQDRPKAGQEGNRVRGLIESRISEVSTSLAAKEFEAQIEAERIDVTMPGREVPSRKEHPVRSTMEELIRIFAKCGFECEIGPEAEHEFYNFDALNMPPSHPARALQDTFYIKDSPDVVLRTHTSPVQIRTMLSQKPPIRMVAPGRVYRADYDATHSPMFHQIEGLLVDTDVQMGHLKGILSVMVKEFFKEDLKVRLRPSFFPFTEPSAEIDIACPFCKGSGKVQSQNCKTCKGTGWIEIGGCGMVDPEVFKAAKIDHNKYSGFAFGMGIERMTMLKYGVNDLRNYYEGDQTFISQFARWKP
ncbi:phenylalanine--tRNA ligase subunit alpha [bacterium]|nr:phenylalanine--tRNA ligase subunit alpha [bacterium]